MHRRREFLGAVVGASVALSGCWCGDPFPNFGFRLSLEELTQREGSTSAIVAATTYFDNQKHGGIGGLSIGSYAPGPEFQTAATVGSMTWSDVPDGNREDEICGSSGVHTETVELTTDEPPYWLSPRITDQETLREFEDAGFHEFAGLIYDGPAEPWPPDSVTVQDYRPQAIEALPWPRPNDVAPGDSTGTGSASIAVDAHCGTRLRDGPQLSTDDGSATVE